MKNEQKVYNLLANLEDRETCLNIFLIGVTMKFIYLMLVLFIANSGFASTDRVGDSITIEGPFQGNRLNLEASYKSFSNGVMNQEDITSLGGSVISRESTAIASEDILTPETAGMMVAMCASIGGTHEYLNLPVGTTLTCRLNTQSLSNLPYVYSKNLELLGDVVWLGPFPVLGIAQIQLSGELLVIQNYRWN